MEVQYVVSEVVSGYLYTTYTNFVLELIFEKLILFSVFLHPKSALDGLIYSVHRPHTFRHADTQ